MKKNESKRAYMFYVSDYHFEMIGLLNIKKELEENKKVIVLTQNDLEETIKTVLSKINIKEEEKENIEKINWTEKLTTKYEELQRAAIDGEKISIYIKGDEKYIEKQNDIVKKLIRNNKNVSIVDCYNFYEVANKSGEIIRKYDQALVTGAKVKADRYDVV